MKKLYVLVLLMMLFLVPQLVLASEQQGNDGNVTDAVEQTIDSAAAELKKIQVKNTDEADSTSEESPDEDDEEEDDEPDCA